MPLEFIRCRAWTATTDRPTCSAAEANSLDKLSINDADAISLSQIDLDLCESSIRAQNGGNGDGAHQPNGEVETGHLGRSAGFLLRRCLRELFGGAFEWNWRGRCA